MQRFLAEAHPPVRPQPPPLHKPQERMHHPQPGQRLDGQRLDGQRLGGQRLDGQRLGGQRMDGQRLDGQRLDGQRMDGQRLDMSASRVEMGDMRYAPRDAASMHVPRDMLGMSRGVHVHPRDAHVYNQSAPPLYNQSAPPVHDNGQMPSAAPSWEPNGGRARHREFCV
jgi:hypothetical protein